MPNYCTNNQPNQRLLLPNPPKPNPRIRLLPPPNSDLLRVVERLRCVATAFLCGRLLPKPPPEALRLADRNLVLFMLFSDFFEVERNLLDETLLPLPVFTADFDGEAFFSDDVAAPRRF